MCGAAGGLLAVIYVRALETSHSGKIIRDRTDSRRGILRRICWRIYLSQPAQMRGAGEAASAVRARRSPAPPAVSLDHRRCGQRVRARAGALGIGLRAPRPTHRRGRASTGSPPPL